MKFSVKTKMILIALSIVIPGVLLSILGFHATSKQKLMLIQTIMESCRNTAKNIIDRIERDLTYRSMEIADKSLRDGIDGNISGELRKYAEHEGFVDGFFYMDKEGKLIFPQEIPKPKKNLTAIESLYVGQKFLPGGGI